MVELKLYVEGGGDSKSLRTECREVFRIFLTKAGLANAMPRIVACGSRQAAYKDFCVALRNGQSPMLLVDSESLVDQAHWENPWAHLATREGDKWPKPDKTENNQCHLIVVCMESWFLSDRQTVKEYFGQGFRTNALPSASRALKTNEKSTIYNALVTIQVPSRL